MNILVISKIEIRRGLNNFIGIGLFSIILPFFSYGSAAQIIPPITPRLERKISNDLDSFFKSLQHNGPSKKAEANATLEGFAKLTMKNIKRYKEDNSEIFTNYLSYSREIKKGNYRVPARISFHADPLDTSQFYILQSLHFLPKDDLEKIYDKILKAHFGDKLGNLSSGSKIYTNNSLPGYISLNYDSSSGYPYLIFYPKGFFWIEISIQGKNRRTPFLETIIMDSLPK